MLVTAYHMLRDGTVYHDLSGDYFDQRSKEQLQHLVKRLERLGLQVTFTSVVPLAT